MWDRTGIPRKSEPISATHVEPAVERLRGQKLGRAVRQVLFGVSVSLWLLLLWQFQAPDGLGTDFYPLYLAAVALKRGISPYGPAFGEQLQTLWRQLGYPFFGFVYPLPGLIGLWPILMLPLPAALVLWRTIGAVGSFAAIRLRDDWHSLALLPICFMPLHRTLSMNQPTMIWFALSVLLLLAIQRRWSWVVGYCIVLLPCKPQTGLVFAVAGLLWSYKQDRTALLWTIIWGLLIYGGSFVVEPLWVQRWLVLVRSYTSEAYTPSLLPWGIALIAVTWRLPWYARLAVAQVVLFPLTDAYSTLPLLLVWVAIGGPLALVGSSISWLWIFLGLPSNITVVWAVILAPLAVCAAWRSYQTYTARPMPL